MKRVIVFSLSLLVLSISINSTAADYNKVDKSQDQYHNAQNYSSLKEFCVKYGYSESELDCVEVNIETIQTELEEGAWIATSGIVTQPTNTTDLQHGSFYIQDYTQFGVHVFSYERWNPADDLERGDEVYVVGYIDEDHGITRVVDLEYWEVISTGNVIPYTIDLGTGDLSLLGNMEGVWCRTAGYLQEDPREGDYYAHLNDGTGVVTVHILESTNIDMSSYSEGFWIYIEGIISLYSGGNTVKLVPSIQEDLFNIPTFAPLFLNADIDTSIGRVDLRWMHNAFGEIEELTYDNNTPTTSYQWPGHTMASWMDPGDSCQVLALKFLVESEDSSSFNAEIHTWDDLRFRPGGERIMQIPAHVDANTNGWVVVNTIDERIFVQGGFLPGFGSINNTVELAGDNNYNRHSWDFDSNRSLWTSWTDTYYIRAIVQFDDGEVVEIGNGSETGGELDDWLNFYIYRNNVLIDSTQNAPFYRDNLDANGEYAYRVTAMYHEGETDPSNSVTVRWGTESIENNDRNEIPSSWSIASTYPNPFNSAVQVTIAVPQTEQVRMEIFDINGRTISILQNDILQPGYHQLSWNPETSSGIYFVKVSTTSGWSDVQKLVFLK